ncbi:MAG: hypothetical protein P4L53_13915 [Candidatus Obscuribacterales bacterium]|nr:hypothetical protein [Candidatus Obscuribacterales bacterium]
MPIISSNVSLAKKYVRPNKAMLGGTPKTTQLTAPKINKLTASQLKAKRNIAKPRKR